MKLWQKTTAGVLIIAGVSAGVVIALPGKYEDPPARHGAEVFLENLPTEERRVEKAKILAAAEIPDTDGDKVSDFTIDGITIKVKSLSQTGELLKVMVEASLDGYPLAVDNPYFYKNPPIKVPTGKYHRELIDEKEKDVMNYRVDAVEALKQILIESIKLKNSL